MADLPAFDPARSALVIIDLQRMIMARDTAPHSAQTVLERNAELADAMRGASGLVVCVCVSFSQDLGDRLTQTTDLGQPPMSPPPGYDTIAPDLKPDAERTIVVRKRQWGAFYGTDLDMQLRRRGIDTILLTGISTNIGVESTARSAYEHGYRLYFVEDAMSCLSLEEHVHSIRYIFPRIGHVCSCGQVLEHLGRD